MTVLLCPLCSQPRFNNLESLRLSLINAATQSISCPICSEVLMGLDKLTIHLFGHTLNQNSEWTQCLELKTKPEEPPAIYTPTEERKEPEDTFAPIENVENLKLDCYDLQGMQTQEEVKNSTQCTVNMEDLSFLTSWENSYRAEDSKDSETNSSPVVSPVTEKEDSQGKEENVELSEYMSDLLNKKLPILNFVFMDVPEKTVQDQDNKQFKCPTCDFAFQNSIILSMHQELVHSKCKVDKNAGKRSADGAGDYVAPAPAEEKIPTKEVNEMLGGLVLPRYDCHLCSKSFKMKGSLLVHYRVAHIGVSQPESLPVLESPTGNEERNFHCSICSKSFKKEQHLTQHIKTHEGKQWQCETCNKHFTTKYFLKKHQRLHTGEMPYSCQTCNKTFTFQQSYHKHLLYHSDEKPHQCSQCGRSFKELSTLHNHQRIHSGEKPFACETCGKCFRQRVSYIVHQRIHTGVLPYQCTACKKKFRYKVSQRSHKCSAQPPGIVVRQPDDLIQRILENRNDTPEASQLGNNIRKC